MRGCLAAVDGWVWVVEEQRACKTQIEVKFFDIAQQDERGVSRAGAKEEGAVERQGAKGCERVRLTKSRGRDRPVDPVPAASV